MTSERRDLVLLLTAAATRAAAVGLIAVLLGVWLEAAGAPEAAATQATGAGLLGVLVATWLVTRHADRLGRRRTQVGLCLVSAAGAGALLIVDPRGSPAVLLIAAFVGMVNGMGRDRGAALALEQAMVPATVPAARLARAFAWHALAQDAGHAVGAVLAGAPVAWARWRGAGPLEGCRAALGLYAILSLAAVPAYLALRSRVEAPPRTDPGARVGPPAGSARVRRLAALFAVDALGSGFLTTAGLAFLFARRFAVSPEGIAVLFALARVLNAGSHLLAAALAARIGLLRTMVFTHLPSSLLLVLVAWTPSFPVAAALFLVREALVEMDVPARSAYVMALVPAPERTAAAGATSLTRLCGWAAGAWAAGPLAAVAPGTAVLVVGAALKVVYDVSLWVVFRRVVPAGEEPGAGSGG